jgi:hypothetical protein
MWLAVVMFCPTPNVLTCQVIANLENLHYSEEACMADATSVATVYNMQNMYAKGGCFKIGESV